jgi:hypothetical protein
MPQAIPQTEITLQERTVTRGHIANDFGHRVQWKVTKNGAEAATPEARVAISYTHADTSPGMYEIVLETWQHDGFRSGGQGKYIAISNKVSYRI